MNSIPESWMILHKYVAAKEMIRNTKGRNTKLPDSNLIAETRDTLAKIVSPMIARMKMTSVRTLNIERYLVRFGYDLPLVRAVLFTFLRGAWIDTETGVDTSRGC
jgi:hypothetical protein|tara:strand:+ start:167 stop:481 length:315 start_codon:yes stop_codon:yes gene_type:complete